VPPFRETHDYVARIVHDYNTKKIAQEKEAKQKQALTKASTKASVPAKSAASAKAPVSAKAAAAAKPAASAIAAESPR
jgi:hypothetical protein